MISQKSNFPWRQNSQLRFAEILKDLSCCSNCKDETELNCNKNCSLRAWIDTFKVPPPPNVPLTTLTNISIKEEEHDYNLHPGLIPIQPR